MPRMPWMCSLYPEVHSHVDRRSLGNILATVGLVLNWRLLWQGCLPLSDSIQGLGQHLQIQDQPYIDLVQRTSESHHQLLLCWCLAMVLKCSHQISQSRKCVHIDREILTHQLKCHPCQNQWLVEIHHYLSSALSSIQVMLLNSPLHPLLVLIGWPSIQRTDQCELDLHLIAWRKPTLFPAAIHQNPFWIPVCSGILKWDNIIKQSILTMWVKIGVNTACLPSLYQFDSLHYLMREWHLCKAHFPSDLSDSKLTLWACEGMH